MDYDSEDHGPQLVVIAVVFVSILLSGLIIGGLGLFFLHDFWWFGVVISGGIIGWIIAYVVLKRPGEK